MGLGEFFSLANITATSLIGVLLAWLVMKGHPDMIREMRADSTAREAKFLEHISEAASYRERAMQSGHEAAGALAGSIDRSTQAISRLEVAVLELGRRTD